MTAFKITGPPEEVPRLYSANGGFKHVYPTTHGMMTITAIAKKIGVTKHVISYRINKWGWDDPRTIAPPRAYNQQKAGDLGRIAEDFTPAEIKAIRRLSGKPRTKNMIKLRGLGLYERGLPRSVLPEHLREEVEA